MRDPLNETVRAGNLLYVDGKGDELYGRIQKRTGESRDAVEKAIKDAGSCCG